MLAFSGSENVSGAFAAKPMSRIVAQACSIAHHAGEKNGQRDKILNKGWVLARFNGTIEIEITISQDQN